MLDFEAFWRIVLPVLATPVSSRHFAGWLRVALMPGSEASAPVWIGLFDLHVRITIPNRLGFSVLAGTNHELLIAPRGAPRAVTG